MRDRSGAPGCPIDPSIHYVVEYVAHAHANRLVMNVELMAACAAVHHECNAERSVWVCELQCVCVAVCVRCRVCGCVSCRVCECVGMRLSIKRISFVDSARWGQLALP